MCATENAFPGGMRVVDNAFSILKFNLRQKALCRKRVLRQWRNARILAEREWRKTLFPA